MRIFGLGGRAGEAQWPYSENLELTLWNSEETSKHYHPFYIFMNTKGDFTGVFDLSTEPIQYSADAARINAQILLTTVQTSEVLQKYIFNGQTPEDVVKKYQTLVGRPTVPPEWAFGWGANREGLKDAN